MTLAHLDYTLARSEPLPTAFTVECDTVADAILTCTRLGILGFTTTRSAGGTSVEAKGQFFSKPHDYQTT